MKQYLWMLFTISISHAFAQGEVSTAGWKAHPVIVDGRLTEWNQPLQFYDAGSRLFFDIANDSSNIYLCFESRDELTQTKLMQAGMKLTLNTKGKARQEASILYPVPPKPATQNTGSDGAQKEVNLNTQSEPVPANKSSFRTHFIQTHSVMQLEGFATAKGEVPLQNPSGITAAINWDTASNLGYEIVIPQKEFFGTGYAAGNISPADITLSVEIGSLPRSYLSDDKSNRNRGNGSNSNVRRGQFTGGGYNTGNEGAPREWGEQEKVLLNTKSSFKQKFVLGKKAM